MLPPSALQHLRTDLRRLNLSGTYFLPGLTLDLGCIWPEL